MDPRAVGLNRGEFLNRSNPRNQNFSLASCKSLEGDEVKGAVGFVGEFLLGFFEGGAARTKHCRQQRRAQQSQGTSTRGVAKTTFVLASEHIAPPMHLVLDSPVTADLLGQLRRSRFVGPEAGHEVARAAFGLAGAFVGLVAWQAHPLSGVWISSRIGFDVHPRC